jgi:NAD(P)-dependent dehydrogenase (short-subunit alcohol dehydrogenase family)
MAAKTILITGASGGFGRMAVPLLLGRGHTVIAALRGGEERMHGVFGDEHIGTGRLHALDLHMERPESFEAVHQVIRREHGGRLDVLVNNAGYGLLGPADEIAERDLREQMEVNFFGPVLLIQALLPALREARGRILNVSSVLGLVAFPFYGPYAASKFALEGYTEALRYDLQPAGVQVGLIEPGGFKTDFVKTATTAAITVPLPASSPNAERVERFNAFLQGPGNKAGGNPMRVARLIAKLCDRRTVPPRSIIGTDAWFMGLLRRLLPHRLRAWLVGLGFRKVVFRD